MGDAGGYVKRLRYTVTAIAAVAVHVVLLACAGAASADAPEFAGHMEFTGTHTAYATLHLDHDLVPLPQDDKSKQMRFDINSSGWLRYFELRAVTPTGEGGFWPHPTVQIMRFDSCGIINVLCSKGDYIEMGFVSQVLPAGDYQAYVVTQDGHESRAVLDFPTLSGSLKITPDQPTPWSESSPTPHSSLGPTTTFGTSGRIEGEGVAFLRVRSRSDTPSADRVENCAYWNGDPRGTALAGYGIGCDPGLLNAVPTGTPSLPRYGEDYLQMAISDHAQTVGIGGNLTTGGVPAIVEPSAGFLTYATPPPGTAPTGVPVTPPNSSGESTRVASPQPTGQDSPSGGLAFLAARSVRVRGRVASIPLRCVGEQRCRGFVGFDRTRRLTPFNIGGNSRVGIRLRLTKSLMKALRHKGRASARLLVQTQRSETTSNQHALVTLRRATHKRR